MPWIDRKFCEKLGEPSKTLPNPIDGAVHSPYPLFNYSIKAKGHLRRLSWGMCKVSMIPSDQPGVWWDYQKFLLQFLPKFYNNFTLEIKIPISSTPYCKMLTISGKFNFFV